MPSPTVHSSGGRFILFDRILAVNTRDLPACDAQAGAAADVSALEREIDQLVYALYSLTPEEIEIVEGSAERKCNCVHGREHPQPVVLCPLRGGNKRALSLNAIALLLLFC